MSEPEKKEEGGTFDMYHFFSRGDVTLAVVFIIAFVIFTLALFLHPVPA